MTQSEAGGVAQERTRAIRVLVVALVVQLLVSAWVMPFVPDDAYIAFRYAENLSDGSGLTFNTGDDPVEGYSNFLWVLVLALLRSAGLPLSIAAPMLGLVLGLLCTVVVWRVTIASHLPLPHAFIALLFIATAGPFVIYTVSGLETALFVLLLLLLVRVGGRQQHNTRSLTLDAVVGACVALCRPEGVVAFPVVAAILVTRGGVDAKRIAIPAAVFVSICALYTIWRVDYFGEFWPTPFLAKSAGGVGGFVTVWIKNLRQFFVVQGPGFPPAGFYYLALTVAAWLGWRRTRDRCDATMIAFGVALVYGAVYVNFVDWMPGMRYHAALLPLLVLPAAHALAAHPLPAMGERTAVWVGVVVLLVNLSFFAPLRLSAKRLERGTEQCLIPLANWLVDYGPQDPVLAVSDVGAIPYYTGFHTIDINPESLTDRYIAHNGFSPDYFYSTNADVLVLVSQGVHLPRFYPEHYAMTQSTKFDVAYRLIGVARYDWVQDRSYWVYFPRDWPPLSDEAYEAFPAGVGKLRRLNR